MGARQRGGDFAIAQQSLKINLGPLVTALQTFVSIEQRALQMRPIFQCVLQRGRDVGNAGRALGWLERTRLSSRWALERLRDRSRARRARRQG